MEIFYEASIHKNFDNNINNLCLYLTDILLEKIIDKTLNARILIQISKSRFDDLEEVK